MSYLVKENLVTKLESCPENFSGEYFDINLVKSKSDSKKVDQSQSEEKIRKRPVGRPRKLCSSEMSIFDLVDQNSLNSLMRWIHDDQNVKISSQYYSKKKKNFSQGRFSHYVTFKVRRQKGYKKNMACPLLHMLTQYPCGHTTRVLTEEVLHIMQSKVSEESQQKMRRRIYEFLLVMKTVGLVYSEQEQVPYLAPYLLKLIEEYRPEYFANMPRQKIIDENLKIQRVSDSQQGEDQEQRNRKKKYNKKKALIMQSFLTTPCLRDKHLHWYGQRIKRKEEMLEELKTFYEILRKGKFTEVNDLFVVSKKGQTEHEFPIQHVFPLNDEVGSHLFGIALVDDRLLNETELVIVNKTSKWVMKEKKIEQVSRLFPAELKKEKLQPFIIQKNVKKEKKQERSQNNF